MKNKKLYISMLILIVSFLIAMYVLKFFFPQEFIMAIENEKIINIGNYIDSHAWAYYLFGIFTSFITYSLYCCAVCRRMVLKWWEYLIILITIGASIGFSFIDSEIVLYIGIVSFIILPCIFKAKLREVAIVYPIHSLAQILTLKIRNLPIYIQYHNSLFFALLTFECYLWLILFYIILNLKKEGK